MKTLIFTFLFSTVLSFTLSADVILRHVDTGETVHFEDMCYKDFPNSSDYGWECFHTPDCDNSENSAYSKDLPRDILNAFNGDGYAYLPMQVQEEGEKWLFSFAGHNFFNIPKAMFASGHKPVAHLVKASQQSTTLPAEKFANLSGMNRLNVLNPSDTGQWNIQARIEVTIDQPAEWRLFDLQGRLLQRWPYAGPSPLAPGVFQTELPLQKAFPSSQIYVLTLFDSEQGAVLSTRLVR